MPAPIVLLTDFGLTDPYVGQMKATLLHLSPEKPIIDLSHDIRPFCIGQAAFFLASSFTFFPVDTFFVVVVDPGVGTERSLLYCRCDGKHVLAPDNGLLHLLLENYPDAEVNRITVPPGHFTEISNTFHGRDLFAPLAAYLSKKQYDYMDITPTPASEVVSLQYAAPSVSESSLSFSILHIDRFGNIILNGRNEPWYQTILTNSPVYSRNSIPIQPVRTYYDLSPGRLGVLPGSQGFLEIAVNSGSAAEIVNASLFGDFPMHYSTP